MPVLTHRLLTPAVLVALGLAACAAPEEPDLDYAGRRARQAGRGADEASEPSDGDEDGASEKPMSTTQAQTDPAPTPSPPAIDVSFAGADKQTFDGITVARVCSDRGAHHSNATWVDAKWLELVSVDAPGTAVVRVEGADFEKLRTSVMESGRFEVRVDPGKLPNEPKELAIITGGDSRFASPADCKKPSLRPSSAKQRDVEEFPNDNTMLFNTKVGGTGCGIVGYVQAHYDKEMKKVVAKPSSQLLLAADDEGRAGFPKGAYYPGCDGHDSPLVLDLGGRGVALGAPRADVFDVDGDGARDESPWVVSEETPFLVYDRNHDGVVDGVDELFGNRTRGPSGERASANGFEALALWDDAADGVIDRHDAIWSSLRLWFDKNHDGRTDPGELVTLASRGVRSISLAYVPVAETLEASGRAQGSVRQRGGATMADGRVVSVVDVWFHRKL